MKMTRFGLIVIVIGLHGFVSHAQESTTPINTDDMIILGVLGIFFVIGTVVLAYRRSRLKDDEYEELLTLTHSPTEKRSTSPPIVYETVFIRPPISRSGDDTRPYLVLELRRTNSDRLPVGEQWIITPDDVPYSIGTSPDATLHIDDNWVSGKHIYIDYNPKTAQYTLIDKNSSNGSRWNGGTMTKKRAYTVTPLQDVTLELAVSYIFTVYIDEVSSDEPIQVSLPSQNLLPDGVKAQLNWQSPQTGTEQEIEIREIVTTIGRGEGSDAQINHDLISKTHAHIVWKEDHFDIVDVSSNGTWLTSGSRGRTLLASAEFVPMSADATHIINIAQDFVSLTFTYTTPQSHTASEEITDKLPALPMGIHPLLHVVREGDSEQRKAVPISTSIITIGSAGDSIVRFVRESVAEKHAKIVWEDGRFRLYDLSGRGTSVNGQMLHGARIDLEEKKVYHIIINENRSSEIKIAFHYSLQHDLIDPETLTPSFPENTQRLDANFS